MLACAGPPVLCGKSQRLVLAPSKNVQYCIKFSFIKIWLLNMYVMLKFKYGSLKYRIVKYIDTVSVNGSLEMNAILRSVHSLNL